MGIGNRRGRLRRRWRISRYGKSGRVTRRSTYTYLFHIIVIQNVGAIFGFFVGQRFPQWQLWKFIFGIITGTIIGYAIGWTVEAWDRHHRGAKADYVDKRAAEIISWLGRPDQHNNPHVYHNYIKLVHDNDHDGGVYDYEQRGDFRD
jgi:hypothetical protein